MPEIRLNWCRFLLCGVKKSLMEQPNPFSKYLYTIVRVLIVAVLYFMFGKFAFAISVSNGIVTNAPFFSEGVALASTILFGYFNAVGVFLGQFVLAITSGVDINSSILVSLINSLLAILGRYLFLKFKVTNSFLGFRNILLLSTIILLVVQPLSAILGNLILFQSEAVNLGVFIGSCITWWLGNSIGQLVLVPLLLIIFTQQFSLKSFVVRDFPIALLSFLGTFLIFKMTYNIDSSYTFLALFILFPLTLLFSAKGKPRTVVLSLFLMIVAAFTAISLNVVNLPDINRWDTFMKLDLLIISLVLCGLFLTFLLDDRRKVENALRKSESQLKETNKTKDKLFSIIAHDLKSPFTSIVGYSEILKDFSTNCNPQEMVNYASIINTSSKQTLQLLENLLDWARLQQGRMNFRPMNLNLFDISNTVVSLLNDNANQKDVYIKNLISDSVYIYADEEMIKMVLRNLATNAIKFTQPGGVVELSAKLTDTDVNISVTDNGVGISAENIGKLFDIASNFTTKGTNEEKGTGLGLSLCKEFVEKHNGRIWVKSELGKGSIFTFSLPLLNKK